MIMINIKTTERPLIVVGKPGTGKTTKALNFLPPNPIIKYADEYDIDDNFSIPRETGILIEEVHYKPKVDLIVKTLLEYKGKIVLTSVNQKDVDKKIYDKCKLKRAGTTNYALLALQEENACVNAESYIGTLEKNIFEMINIYLKSKDRDAVAEMLKFNKPFDEQILAWAMSSLNTEKIAWIDAKVKRKWSSDYFFELLAYAHNGMPISFSPPRRRAYDKRPSICKKIGMRPDEYEMLTLLKQDPDFEHYMYTKLSSVERVKLGVKKGKAKKPTIANSRLEDYF
jgi:hypothetical protein